MFLERQPRALCGQVLCTIEHRPSIMYLPQNCAPGSPTSLHTLRSTFQCRSHRKSVLSSVFYHQFPIKNHSSSCPGAPACCLWGKQFSRECAAELSRAELRYRGSAASLWSWPHADEQPFLGENTELSAGLVGCPLFL